MTTEPASERFDGAGYRQLLDTAPDAIVVVGDDSRIAYVNVQTERMFGYARAELVGQGLELLIPDRFHGAHGGHMARYFAAPQVRGMGSGLELFGKRKDGVEIPIEVSLSPVRAGGRMTVSAAIRDISERKRAQAALKLSSERLTSAIESIQDAFALFDAAGHLLQCNSSYRQLIGEAMPGQLVGRSFEDILTASMTLYVFESDGAKADFRRARLGTADPGGALRGIYDVRTKDGRSLRIADRPTPEGGTVQTVWDLTEDVRREEELRAARLAAEAGSAAKSEFLSSMSHELRTPLNAILGFAQLLQRDKKEPLSERHRERVGHILKGGEHLLRLIDDILDLSKIEAGGVAISTEPISLPEVLEEVMTTLGPTASRAGVTLSLASGAPSVPAISADRTRVAQILMNFGSNAIKYNRPGGTVTFVMSQLPGTRVRAAVEDTGFGIPLDKQDKVFQPFQRAGQETGPIEGTGIGLTITKRLAELMGADVGFRSVAGGGSTFWVDLPVHDAEIEKQLVAPLDLSTVRASESGPGLILYVEDNPANVTFMRDLLGSFEGIELITSPTAELGIELAKARMPAVILMDINLPGISGLDALRALKELPATRDIPVIALTAAASERDRQRGEQAGFFRYLTKPVKVDELEAALRGLLARAP